MDLSVGSEADPGDHITADVGALEVERNTVGVLVKCGAAEVEFALDGGPRGVDLSVGSEADPGDHITADVGALEVERNTVGVVECGAAEDELALDGGLRGADCSMGFEGVDLSVGFEGPGDHTAGDLGALEVERIAIGVVECGAAEDELALDGGPPGVDCSMGFEGVDLSVSFEGPGEHTSGDVGALEVERNTVGVVECGAAEDE